MELLKIRRAFHPGAYRRLLSQALAPSDLPPVDPDEGLDKFPRHRLQLQGKKHQGRLGVCRLRGVPVPRARYEVGGIVLADQDLMKDCGVSADMVAVAQNDALGVRIC